MKQFIRYFSFGLFISSTVLLVYYTFFYTPVIDSDNLSTDEMIEFIEEDGYRVISEEDYISFAVSKDEKNKEDEVKKEQEDKKNEPKEDQDKDEKDEKDEKDIKKYKLKIVPNMLPNEVADLLKENGIIKDSLEFSTFLDKKKYSPFIQLGEFELNSDMTHEEIAKVITKNRV